jgi:hypothetical protein
MHDVKLVNISGGGGGKRKYLKAKFNEFETNSKKMMARELYRDISDFKKGYPPRTNRAQGEKGDLDAQSHSILASWKNCFYQVLTYVGLMS